MSESRQTRRSDVDLLRQLASAVASYRLFPGDTQQDGFQAAAARVIEAANATLVAGPLHVDIRSGHFKTSRGEVPNDEVLDRFAVLCFERRVEHIHIVRAPNDRDLAALGEVLSLPVGEALESGGASAHLRARGVSSIVMGEVAPEGTDEADLFDLARLSPDQLALWERLKDPDGLAASLLVSGLPSDPSTAAQDLYGRFRALHEVLPTAATARSDLFGQIRRVLDHLPTAVAREFTATVMSRLTRDTFASDHAIDLTDSELADVLVDLARHGGPDPIELGRRIAQMTDRKDEVLALVAARMEGTPDVRDLVKGVRPTMLALSKTDDETQVRQAIADALAEGLLSAANADASYLRGIYPDTLEDGRTLALLALRDYLLNETNRASIQRVLDVWTVLTQEAVAALDAVEVLRLLEVLEDPSRREDQGSTREAIAGAVASVPTSALVLDIVERIGEEVTAEEVHDLLRHFGGPALDAVLDLLANAEDRTTRSQLVSLAADLAATDTQRIAQRLGDPRWYVVRNIATILGRVGGADVLTPLISLSTHQDATVRREVARGLVRSGGSDAVPYLRRLADDREASVRTTALNAIGGLTSDISARALADIVRHGSHRDERSAALDTLATHASSETPALLARLASRREKPRLPRELRRRARKLARRLGKDSR